MRRTRWQSLLLVALVVGVLAALLTTELSRRGPGMPTVPWLVAVVELLISAVVFSMGWAVRQFLRGRRPDLNPIRAARTAVLAKAACYTGALLVGWYGGQLVALLLARDVPGSGSRAAAAGVAAGGALVIAVVGLVVEWFCRIPPPEDEQRQESGGAEPDPTPS
ncbi:MAG: hypothetical protein B7X40_04115 [Cellulomonas sp. 14-74-6]|jgi:hypothetical protein|nr:MAG: hypothetical protein B7X40_04115 [Cellulomonas sp. 14-74-6]